MNNDLATIPAILLDFCPYQNHHEFVLTHIQREITFVTCIGIYATGFEKGNICTILDIQGTRMLSGLLSFRDREFTPLLLMAYADAHTSRGEHLSEIQSCAPVFNSAGNHAFHLIWHNWLLEFVNTNPYLVLTPTSN